MNLTFNPIDFENIVTNLGAPPESADFSTSTDETIDRGFVRISGEVDGVSGDDVVPLFVAGIPPSAAMSDDEAAAAAEDQGDLLSSLLAEVFADKLIEMNPAEIARAEELWGAPPMPVTGNEDVPLGCTRVDGDEHCDPEISITHGVLGRNEDGSLYVTSGDYVAPEDVEFSA